MAGIGGTLTAILGIGLGVLLLGLIAFFLIRSKLRQISRQAFGSSDFLKEIQHVTENVAQEPCSVSGGDAIYLPMILKDFPDFNADWMKSRAREVLTAYLSALTAGDPSGMTSFGETLLRQTKEAILQSRKDELPVFREITFYRTTIARYERSGTDRTVKIQSAYSFLDGAGKKHQCRAELWTTYCLRDDGEKKAQVLRCGHCGAPVSELGMKVCPYCGSGNVAILSKAWSWIHLDAGL